MPGRFEIAFLRIKLAPIKENGFIAREEKEFIYGSSNIDVQVLSKGRSFVHWGKCTRIEIMLMNPKISMTKIDLI